MSIKSTRNRQTQKNETRGRILAAAERVFAKRGILASTTAEVAREAGMAHGSVFARFGSQEELICAVIEDFGDRVARRLHELVSFEAGVRRVLEAHLAAIAEKEDLYTHLVVEAPLLPSRARDSLIAIQSSICYHLSPAIEAGTQAGELVPMPVHLFFNTWVGLLHYYLANRELFAPGGSVIERRGTELLDHFSSLIARKHSS